MTKPFFSKDADTVDTINYLENIIALMPGHVYWKDRNCVLQGCNDLQAINSGLKSRQDVVGKTAYDLLYRKDQPEEAKRAQAAITDKIDREIMDSGVEKTVEEFGVRPDGSISTFLSRKVPIRDSQGDVVGLLGISFDISDRKKLEEDLRQQTQRAQAAEKKIEKAYATVVNFLATIANILRGPLSCIIGASQVLLARKPKSADKPLLEAILSSSQGITPILDRAAFYLDIDHDHLKAHASSLRFDLKRFFQKLVAPYEKNARTKGLQFQLDYSSQLPRWVHGDHTFLRQVLLNLLDNAQTYTAKGSIRVSVSAQALDEELFTLVVHVADTGRGISPEAQACLFDLYKPQQRLPSIDDQPTFTKPGVSLSLSAQLVKLLKGTISVESKVHQGTTFTLCLPLSIAQPPKAGEQGQSTSYQLVKPLDTPIHLLIIEDHPIAQQVLQAMLKQDYRCTIDAVYTYQDALERIGKPYDLIFCDINLPDGNGLDFIRALQAKMGRQAPRVIVSTTFTSPEESYEMQLAGATDWLPKPIDMDALRTIMEHYVFSNWREEDEWDEEEPLND